MVMPNVITPQQETIQEPNTPIDHDVLDAGFDLRNVEFLNYLGMKDELFNEDVMTKISELVDFFGEVDALQEADINTSEKTGLTKLDKLYTYIQLLRQEDDINKKRDLINKAKQQYVAG